MLIINTYILKPHTSIESPNDISQHFYHIDDIGNMKYLFEKGRRYFHVGIDMRYNDNPLIGIHLYDLDLWGSFLYALKYATENPGRSGQSTFVNRPTSLAITFLNNHIYYGLTDEDTSLSREAIMPANVFCSGVLKHARHFYNTVIECGGNKKFNDQKIALIDQLEKSPNVR